MKNLIAHAFIDNLADEWNRIIILWTIHVQVMVISAKMDGTLFFSKWTRFETYSIRGT